MIFRAGASLRPAPRRNWHSWLGTPAREKRTDTSACPEASLSAKNVALGDRLRDADRWNESRDLSDPEFAGPGHGAQNPRSEGTCHGKPDGHHPGSHPARRAGEERRPHGVGEKAIEHWPDLETEEVETPAQKAELDLVFSLAFEDASRRGETLPEDPAPDRSEVHPYEAEVTALDKDFDWRSSGYAERCQFVSQRYLDLPPELLRPRVPGRRLLVAVVSREGSGKTTALRQHPAIAEAPETLVITPRRLLTRRVASDFGCRNASELPHAARVATTIHSAPRVGTRQTMVIDEASQVLAALGSRPVCQVHGAVDTEKALAKALRAAELVVLSDANLTPRDLDYYTQVGGFLGNGGDVVVLVNEYAPTHIEWRTQHFGDWLHTIESGVNEATLTEVPIAIACASAKMAESLGCFVESLGGRPFVVTGGDLGTATDPKVAEALRSGEYPPHDVLIYSPVIGTGFSIDRGRYRRRYASLMTWPGGPTGSDLSQLTERVRASICDDTAIWTHLAASRLRPKEITVPMLARSRAQANGAVASGPLSEGIARSLSTASTLATLASRGRALLSPPPGLSTGGAFDRLRRRKGATIQWAPQYSDEQRAAIVARFREASAGVLERRATEVVQADPVTPKRALQVERDPDAVRSAKLSAARTRIAMIYGVRPTPELAKVWLRDKGASAKLLAGVLALHEGQDGELQRTHGAAEARDGAFAATDLARAHIAHMVGTAFGLPFEALAQGLDIEIPTMPEKESARAELRRHRGAVYQYLGLTVPRGDTRQSWSNFTRAFMRRLGLAREVSRKSGRTEDPQRHRVYLTANAAAAISRARHQLDKLRAVHVVDRLRVERREYKAAGFDPDASPLSTQRPDLVPLADAPGPSPANLPVQIELLNAQGTGPP